MSTKIINNISEIEGVKSLERIKVNYYNPKSKDNSLMQFTGVFAGDFNIEDDKYFVVSEVRDSKMFPDKLFAFSGLYSEREEHIIHEDNHYTTGHCDCSEPDSNLESELKRHVIRLKEMKLNEIKLKTLQRYNRNLQ